MKTINLKEILKSKGSFSPINEYLIVCAMKEAVRQVLELAAENAEIETHQNGCRECGAWGVSDKSILNTINQVV
jgi:hypothetical protein